MKEAGNALSAAAKTFDNYVKESLKVATENLEAENSLAAVSNYDFVLVLRPVASELSEWTGKRYIDYLDQANEMLLEGKDQADVLWHFDSMLRDLA